MKISTITREEYQKRLISEKFFLSNPVYLEPFDENYEAKIIHIEHIGEELFIYSSLLYDTNVIFTKKLEVIIYNKNSKKKYIINDDKYCFLLNKFKGKTVKITINNTYIKDGIIPYVSPDRKRHLTLNERISFGLENKFFYHLYKQNKDLIDKTLFALKRANIDLGLELLEFLILVTIAFGKNVPRCYKTFFRELIKDTYPLLYFSKLKYLVPKYKIVLFDTINKNSGSQYINSKDIVFLLDRKNSSTNGYCKFYDRGIIQGRILRLGWGIIANEVEILELENYDIPNTTYIDEEYWKGKERKIYLPYSLENFTYGEYLF